MLYRIALLSALVTTLLCLAPQSARAQPAPPLQVDTVAHGVVLSLFVPRAVYARDTLARVTVRVRNVSRGPLAIVPGFTDARCALDNPRVQSLTPAGVVRYPPAVPAVPGEIQQPCVGGGGSGGFGARSLLPPGGAAEGQMLVILSAARVRAVVTLAAPGRLPRTYGPAFTVVGRALALRLTSGPAARIVPCAAVNGCFRVLPPAGARVYGPLYYTYASQCRDARGNLAYGQDARLTPTGNTMLHLGCGAPLAELHVVAGWPGWPVARLDLRRSADAGLVTIAPTCACPGAPPAPGASSTPR